MSCGPLWTNSTLRTHFITESIPAHRGSTSSNEREYNMSEEGTAASSASAAGRKHEFPIKGVSLRWWLDFLTTDPGVAAIMRDEGKASTYTGYYLMRRVKEITKEREESVGEMLERTRPQFVKEVADVYISCAWRYLVRDIVTALDTLLKDLPKEEDIFVYMASLIINQHKAERNEYDQEFWREAPQVAIREIGRIVVIATPWDNPYNLIRSWCLWDLYGAMRDENVKVEVVVVPSQREDFRKALQSNPHDIVARLRIIDVTKATAESEKDQEMILNAVRTTKGGITAMQECVVGPIRKWLTSEAITVIDELEAKGDNLEELALMYNNVGVLLGDQGLFHIQERYSRKAVELFKQVFGDEHPKVANSLNNLAHLLENQGKYEEAGVLYRESLAIRKKEFGDEHPDVATSLSGLANLLRLEGKYGEAGPLCQNAQAIHQMTFGKEHSSRAGDLYNLAELLCDQGKYKEAELLFRKSMTIMKRALGDDHPEVATILSGLANVLREQGKYVEAEPLYREALVIRKKVLGDEHPDVADSLHGLALLFQDMGQLTEAEIHVRHAIEINKSLFGEKHPEVAFNFANLASILKDQGKFDEADVICQQALQIGKSTFSNAHPRVAFILRIQSEIDLGKNKLDEAELNVRESLNIMKSVFGMASNHKDIAESLLILARVLHAKKQDVEASEMEKESLKIFEEALGPDNSKTIKARFEGSAPQRKMEEDSADEKLTVSAIEILKRSLALGAAQELNRGKIMMIGPGRAGKSATVRSLLKKDFDPNLKSTCGADANQTCSVDRNDNVVNWKQQQEKVNQFEEHTAMFVAKNLKQHWSEQESEANYLLQTAISLKNAESLTSMTQDEENEARMSDTFERRKKRKISVTVSQLKIEDPFISSKGLSPTDCVEKGEAVVTETSSSTTTAATTKLTEDSMEIELSSSASASTLSMVTSPKAALPTPVAFAVKDTQEAMKVVEKSFFISRLKEETETKKGEMSQIAVSIWDLGGQEVFYTLHHLFLTKYAVYLCIFDMQQMVSTDKEAQKASMNYTNFWLRSIQMHAPGAPVILIGTFKDKVPDLKQHRSIHETLSRTLMFKTIAPTLVINEADKLVFFPIDNSIGVLDPMIVKLQEIILMSISKMEHIRLKVPLMWTQIYDKMMETKQKSITMGEVREISEKCELVNKDQMLLMLNLFHELGMILYFSQTDELNDLIVLDPQWLVDAVTMVIRDFNLHSYPEDLQADLLMPDYAEDYMKLQNESIASVNLMNRLWKAEDNNSEIDFTRRKFLISLMEDMTLSCAWRFGEEYAESEDADVLQHLSLPSRYLVPSNLRLFRPKEIELAIQEKIDERIQKPQFPRKGISDSDITTLNCFIIDFSFSFLPIGLFDRLVCLLVAYSSLVFKESRRPLVANGSALLSFNVNDFRIDEDISRNQIVFTMGEETDRLLILATIESMVAKLKDEVMGEFLKYRILIVVWIEGGKKCAFVDVEKARDAITKKHAKIRDTEEDLVATKLFATTWVTGKHGNNEEVKMILQNIPEGKSNHVFLIHSSSVTSLETVKMLQQELVGYGVRFAPSEIQKGIDSSVCVVLLLTEKVFDDENVQTALKYVCEQTGQKGTRIPVILVQERGGNVNLIFDHAPSDIQAMFSNIDHPLVVKRRYHEKIAFMKELVSTINAKCEELMKAIPTQYLAFLSHVKKDAGPIATLLLTMLHARLKETGQKGVIYLDSDQLTDLRRLPDQVKNSRVFVAMLTEFYLTRPWCLVELHTALENKIPMIAVNIARGGHNYEKTAAFLASFSPETLDQRNSGASATLEMLGINVIELGKKLHAVLPYLKAINFDPNEVADIRDAQMNYILKQIQETAQSLS